jgi:hypothetical protein
MLDHFGDEQRSKYVHLDGEASKHIFIAALSADDCDVHLAEQEGHGATGAHQPGFDFAGATLYDGSSTVVTFLIWLVMLWGWMMYCLPLKNRHIWLW